MNSKMKIVVVFGATGRQGGSVVEALLPEDGFQIRAVTRNPSSDKAEALKLKGLEIVTANLDDPLSLINVLKDAYACFVVTNFWEYRDPQRETTQGKNVADAALAMGVAHVIYSGLDGVMRTIGRSVPHFDAKAEVEDYMKEKSVPFTCLCLSAYYENFLAALKPRKLPGGTYEAGVPMEGVPMYGISVDDTGEIVRSILKDPETYNNQCVRVAGDYLTSQQYVDVLSKVLAPKVIKDRKMTAEEFRKLGFPGADELANMFIYYQKGIQKRNLDLTRKLNPRVMTFEMWANENLEAFLQALESGQ